MSSWFYDWSSRVRWFSSWISFCILNYFLRDQFSIPIEHHNKLSNIDSSLCSLGSNRFIVHLTSSCHAYYLGALNSVKNGCWVCLNFILIGDIIEQFGSLFFSSNNTLMFDCPLQVSTSPSSSTSLDLQYELCSQFMKRTTDQLLQKQIQLINQSAKFIEKYNDSLFMKDISTTQESFTLDTIADEEESFFAPTKSKLLLRKSQSTSCALRRSENGITDAMQEIRRKCSEKTVVLINGIVGDAKRNRQKIMGYDRLEKQLRKAENKYQSREEEHFILKKKLKDMEDANKAFETEMSTLKSKVRQIKHVKSQEFLKGSRISDQSIRSQSSTQQKLKKCLEEKQHQIARKQRDLKAMQQKIQNQLCRPIQQGCEKCCQLMKKVKQSVLKYRNFLEEEATMAEQLYQHYKSSLC